MTFAKATSLQSALNGKSQIAFLGGYLQHRRKTPLGIQVLWRGWLKLHDLCQGYQLAIRT